MIRQLDEALEKMLEQMVPLQGVVKISFDTPNRQWSSTVTEPTLNLFMWDVRRSAHEARSGRIKTDEGYKLAPPRVSCRYHITAWATEVLDEHRILSRVLTTLLPIRTIPAAYMSGTLADSLPAPDFRTATPHVKDFVDFWSALQGEMKSGIDLVVNMTIDSDTPLLPLGPRIADGGQRARSQDRLEPTRRSGTVGREGKIEDEAAFGKIVRAEFDETHVDDQGHFWINAGPGDEVTLMTDPPLVTTVPADGTKITFDAKR